MPKLTDKNVAAISLTTKGQTIIRDTLPGFFVRTGKRTRTFTIQVETTVLGKRKTVTRAIGEAATMGVSEARTLAMAEIAAIKTGTAPHLTPKAERCTLGMAWASYERVMARKVEAGSRSNRTLTGYRDLTTRVLRGWLDVPLAELATKEGAIKVADKHHQISEQAGPYLANRALKLLRLLYAHADDFDLEPEPGLPIKLPTRQIEWNVETRRSTGLALGDLADWNRKRLALDNPVRREFHLISLLTGSRPAALKVARWSDVDIKRRSLTIPCPKGGTGKAFDIPLSRPILRALWRARQAGRVLNGTAAREFIFPAVRGPGHVVETQEKRIDFAFGSRLRETFATLGRSAGVTELHMRILLNHSAGDVSSGYVTRESLAADVLRSQETISRYLVKGF